jgi:signal transduction histidine kinase
MVNIKERINWGFTGFVFLVIIGLYLTTLKNYLLFHTLSELFSISIAFTIFVITWNSKKYISDSYLILIGVAYLFIGGLDLLHTISYKGMEIFTDYDFYANQLWIATRYLESLTLLIAFLLVKRNINLNPIAIFAVYSVITAAIIISIFTVKIFPVCFIEGEGLTPFKVYSEYVIIAILIGASLVLLKNRGEFGRKVYVLLFVSMLFTIISEMAFTLYIDNYGFSNMIGHFTKIFSFYLVYKAIIVTGITEPYDIIFRELKKREVSLSEANAAKTKFFSIIAHDLRNPFHQLLGFTEVLEKRFASMPDERKRKVISDLRSITKNTYDLLEELLLWARAESGRINYEPAAIDLNVMVNFTSDPMKSRMEQKGIAYSRNIPDNLMVNGDVNMVQTIFRNLLSNAIKFTSEGGSISIDARRKNGMVEISVADTGVGMSDEDKEMLFRVDKSNTRKGTDNENGSGLGLILVKEFVEKHQGSLHVQSSPGKGTSFTFTLPAAD